MRIIRRSLLALAVFALASAVLYSSLWFYHAGQSKESLKQAIAALNNENSTFTYQSIRIGGFPTAMRLTIEQPKFSGSMNQMLAPFRTTAIDEFGNAYPVWPEWKEDIAWAGNISLSTDIFSGGYTVKIEGPVTHVSTIENEMLTLVSQPVGASQCTFGLNDSGMLEAEIWDFSQLLEQPMAKLQQLEYLECSTPGFVTTSDPIGEELASSGPIEIGMAREPREGATALTLAVKFEDYLIKPGLNHYLNRYLTQFGDAGAPSSNVNYAATGRQNVDMELSLYGNFDEGANTREEPWSINLSRLEISNSLYNSNTSLMLENRAAPNVRMLSVKLDSESNFNQQYDIFMEDYADLLVRQLKDAPPGEFDELQALLASYSSGEIVDIMSPALPRMNSFGTIRVSTEATLHQDYNKGATHLKLGNLNFNSLPYGLTINGSSYLPNRANPLHAPGANLTLKCRNCLMLVDDLTRYLQRLQSAVITLDPAEANDAPWLPMSMSEAIKDFLAKLGRYETDPESGADVLVFILKGDNGGRLMLNGNPPDKVMKLFNELVGPHMAPAKDGDTT